MDKPADDREFKGRMAELESLLQQVDRIRDGSARDLTGRVIRALMEFHDAAVTRMLEHLYQSGEAGRRAIDEMAGDELVSSLLVLYGLHPHDVEARVLRALDGVRPYLASHGGNVEFLGVTPDGAVRLRMQGSCHGCPSSTATLRNLIESAIFEAAPEIASIELEGDEPAPAAPTPGVGFVPVEQLLAGHRGRLNANATASAGEPHV
ncbi:MAG TPA: NifU family protein [Tepidisphaeraceae bacterium]|jgi:Fe-S cluster biogenesis protein NfuA